MTDCVDAGQFSRIQGTRSPDADKQPRTISACDQWAPLIRDSQGPVAAAGPDQPVKHQKMKSSNANSRDCLNIPLRNPGSDRCERNRTFHHHRLDFVGSDYLPYRSGYHVSNVPDSLVGFGYRLWEVKEFVFRKLKKKEKLNVNVLSQSLPKISSMPFMLTSSSPSPRSANSPSSSKPLMCCS